jgi:hypothetical protein
MILEALNYAATYTKTPAEFRPYIRYSVNLWARANRCAKAWEQHEENSRRFILSSVARLKQRRTVVVLGSGLLRDVPMQKLAAIFDTVVLVDLVHLASVRARIAMQRRNNIMLTSRDLSGYDDLKSGLDMEPMGFLRQVPYLDLVISANLLSQIGTGARNRMEKEDSGTIPADTLPRLIKGHLDRLSTLPCKSCLLTDTAFEVIDINGTLHQREDLLHGVNVPNIAQSWDWPVVPVGEESKDYRIIHKVVAAELT